MDPGCLKKEVDKRVRYFPLGLNKTDALALADQIRGHLMLYPFKDVWEMYNEKPSQKKTKASDLRPMS